jgi:hypothetical protein
MYSQYEWSEPIELAPKVTFPDAGYGYNEVIVDKNGTIHAFWVKTFDRFNLNYEQIMYRSSSDSGSTWVETENLTPEYIQKDVIISYLNVVCDSENNLHLFFLRGAEGSEVMYMKYNGLSWSTPVSIFNDAVSKLNVTIDYNNRIYVLWYNDPMVFSFLEGDSWQEPKPVSEIYLPILSDIIIDRNNNMYACGLIGEYYSYKPFICKYDIMTEQWIDFEEIPGFEGTEAIACALTISKGDTINVNVAVGHTDYGNTNYLIKKNMNDSMWTTVKPINFNMDRDKGLFADNDNDLHLFEFSYNDSSIVHSELVDETWSTYVLPRENETSLQIPKVYFDGSDKFYLTYRKNYTVTNERAIFFQKKQIEVGIEDSEEYLGMDYKLYQNYPNPFNSVTSISYYLSNPACVELAVHNIYGQLLETLVDGKKEKGTHKTDFNASDLSSGMYFYNLAVDGKNIQNMKMLYIR